MPPCNYVTNATRIRYKDHKLFATGVDFDEDGMEQNWRERVVFRENFSPSVSLSKLQVGTDFWGTSITTDFKKNTWNYFLYFYLS